MKELIIVKPEKCVGCNACVRVCPAPEANVTKKLDNGRFVTTVNYDKCIACGECVRNCAHGARDYIDDTEEALADMKRNRMIVIAAPAIKSVFPDSWKSILDWFKKQGCLIFDVSFGADICTWAHLRLLEQSEHSNIITQPCAAIVKYIETYQSALLQDLSPIHSPMLCAVVYIKKYLRYSNPIMALSPCVAKKNEFMETGLVQYNVTFKKLMEYFERNGIRISKDYSNEDFSYNFDGEQGIVGGIYPRAGGLRDNLWLHDPDIDITNSEGVQKVYPELDQMAMLSRNAKPTVFDVLSCEFGCNVGPGTGSKKTFFEVMKTMRDVEMEAKSRRKTSGGLFRGAEDKQFKRFDEDLELKDFQRTYTAAIHTKQPKDEDLNSVFELMGKFTEEDKNYNCHACGYKSCRDMATAIYKGLNIPENCIVHAKHMLTISNQELTTIANDCKALSATMSDDMSSIVKNMGIIRNANGDTSIKVEKVFNLLTSAINFCESVDEINAADMQKFIQILSTTREAFNKLDDSIKRSTESTIFVDNYIAEIDNLIKRVNALLQADGLC